MVKDIFFALWGMRQLTHWVSFAFWYYAICSRGVGPEELALFCVLAPAIVAFT